MRSFTYCGLKNSIIYHIVTAELVYNWTIYSIHSDWADLKHTFQQNLQWTFQNWLLVEDQICLDLDWILVLVAGVEEAHSVKSINIQKCTNYQGIEHLLVHWTLYNLMIQHQFIKFIESDEISPFIWNSSLLCISCPGGYKQPDLSWLYPQDQIHPCSIPTAGVVSLCWLAWMISSGDGCYNCQHTGNVSRIVSK